MNEIVLSRYHDDILAAREVGLQLAGDLELQLLDLLAEFAADLAKLVRAGLASGAQERLYGEVKDLFAELSRQSRSATRAHVHLTAEAVATAHSRAVLGLLRGTGAEGLVPGLRVAFTASGARAAAAVIARKDFARAFRTIRTTSADSANLILRRGILRGAPTTAIERELRMHVGAPGSLLEGDRERLSDLRRIGYDTITELGYEPTRENLLRVRAEAGAIRDKATLIARNETMAAEHEVHARAVQVSPVVAALQVKMSGRHPVPDQCDTAANRDLYGLGPGTYPVDKVPTRFHARCLCQFVHVLRPEHEWGTPRPPSPDLAVTDWDELAEAEGLSPSQVKQLRSALAVGARSP